GGTNNVITGSGTFTVSSTTLNSSYDGLLSGTLALVKDGSGTSLTLTRPNTYTGGTTVNGGTLLVSNATGSAPGHGNVTAAAAGTLGGGNANASAGFIAPDAGKTIQVNGALAPGNGLTNIGVLTIGGGAGTNTKVNVAGSYVFNLATTKAG